MSPKSIKRLEYFVGRVCTIISTSMNRNFNEEVSRLHFVVRIQEINADGIWGTDPNNNDIFSFFALPHIISIHQEAELDPTNPEHAELIKEYEKRTGKKVQSDLPQKITPKIEPKSQDLLPVLQKTPSYDPPKESQEGDSIFIDIDNLERLAETSRRSYEAYDLLGKRTL